jgi:hypothetical protein
MSVMELNSDLIYNKPKFKKIIRLNNLMADGQPHQN